MARSKYVRGQRDERDSTGARPLQRQASDTPTRRRSSPDAASTANAGRRRAAAPRRHVDAVDGLRALCALAVVGYHMGLKWMSGGLLGVTVLFVLTGYFTTDSLVAEFSRTHGTVSLKGYFGRRIRRLIPQAYVCIAVTAMLCTLCNHLLLTKMRPDVVPSLFGFLNWSKILTKVSYFDAAGAPSPLTHFWSLAIEWQFYLVWAPLLVLLLHLHMPKRGIRVLLLVGAIASAVLMAVLYTPGEDPSRAYYGTDTRAMSLLLGCWLALFAPMRKIAAVDLSKDGQARRHVNLAGTFTITVLVVLMVVTKGYTNFSYYGGIALVSVLAVVALGCLMPDGTLISKALALPPLVWIGQRSYALYLWHYPIILLTTDHAAMSGAPVWLRVLQLALSLVAAGLTYRFIEQPCGERGAMVGAFRDFRAALTAGGFAAWARSKARVLVPTLAVLTIGIVGLIAIPPVSAVGGTGGTAGGPAEERVRATALRMPTDQGVHDVTIIGDSVPDGAADEITAAFPNALFDCKISRQMSAGTELLAGYVAQGVVGDTVISCLGTNGPLTEADLDAFVAAAGSGRTVWFVNNRMPDDWQDANNALFASYAESHDNVHVIDWYGYSEGHSDWFWDDATHVRPEGASAYAQMLVDALGYQAPASGTTLFSTLILGDSVAFDAVDDLAAAFPTGAVDCAEGRGTQGLGKAVQKYLDQGNLDTSTKVVLSIGAEGEIDKDALQQVIDKLGSDRGIWLVTTRTNGDWQDANNKTLSKLADANGNVNLIDWYAASEGHDEYFSDDDPTALTEAGAQAYTATITAALAAGNQG